MFEFFKNKFNNAKEQLPSILKGDLIDEYYKVKHYDSDCKLLTTFYDFVVAYDKGRPILWEWECGKDKKVVSRLSNETDFGSL
jgi:hypothetical protein